MTKENESRIEQSMVISGIVVIEGDGRLVLSGLLEGSVTGGFLEISETGKLVGEVVAQSVECAGRLEGNLVTDTFILRSTGCHVGTAETLKLTVDSGAVLDCVLQSGTARIKEKAEGRLDKGAAPEIHLSQVLTAFAEDSRPCCMDMPWSTRLGLLRNLLLLLEKGKPLITVTGEHGSGKSVLVEKLRQSVPAGVEALAIKGRLGSGDGQLQQVAGDLGIGVETAAENERLIRLKAFLDEKRSRVRRLVLLVDDAQDMSPAAMEELVGFCTNTCGGGENMVQLILLGTKKLDAKMSAAVQYFRNDNDCQLKLEPMTIKDTADYLRFCLQLAATGNGSASLGLLPYETIRTLHVLSRGNIGEINRLADKALRAAHAAGASAVYPDFL